jgi:hypothetical protein
LLDDIGCVEVFVVDDLPTYEEMVGEEVDDFPVDPCAASGRSSS